MFIALWLCSVFGMQCCGLWQRKGDNAQTSVQEQSDTLKLHQRHNRHWPWSKRVIGDGQREIFQTDRWAVCSTVPDTNPPAEVKLWRNWCRGKFPQNIRFTHAQTLTEHGEMQKERKKKDVLWAKWEACSNLAVEVTHRSNTQKTVIVHAWDKKFNIYGLDWDTAKLKWCQSIKVTALCPPLCLHTALETASGLQASVW